MKRLTIQVTFTDQDYDIPWEDVQYSIEKMPYAACLHDSTVKITTPVTDCNGTVMGHITFDWKEPDND